MELCNCPNCGSDDYFVSDYFQGNDGAWYTEYTCNDCGETEYIEDVQP